MAPGYQAGCTPGSGWLQRPPWRGDGKKYNNLPGAEVRGWHSIILCGITLSGSLNTFHMLCAMLGLTALTSPHHLEVGQLRLDR